MAAKKKTIEAKDAAALGPRRRGRSHPKTRSWRAGAAAGAAGGQDDRRRRRHPGQGAAAAAPRRSEGALMAAHPHVRGAAGRQAAPSVAGGGLRGAPAGRALAAARVESVLVGAGVRRPGRGARALRRGRGARRSTSPSWPQYATEPYARAIAAGRRPRRSRRRVLIPFTAMGKDLAPRVPATRRGRASCPTACRSTVKDGRLEARRPHVRGQGVRDRRAGRATCRSRPCGRTCSPLGTPDAARKAEMVTAHGRRRRPRAKVVRRSRRRRRARSSCPRRRSSSPAAAG